MKLGCSLLASSLIAALSFTSQAANVKMIDEVNFYGKAQIQLNQTDRGQTSEQDGLRSVEEGLTIQSISSRIGVKGSHKLNELLTAVFNFDFQVTGFDSDTDTLSARSTYIGLKGLFGEVVLGRNNTRFKASEGKFDLFDETASDINQVLAGQDRLGDTLTYTSPKLGLFYLALTAAPKDDTGQDKNGYAWSVTAGDKTLKKSPYYVAYAGAQDLNGFDLQRVLINYRLDDLSVGAMIQQSKTSDGSKDGDGYVLNAGYQMGHWLAKVQYASDDSNTRHSEEAEQLSIGLDYIFDQQARVYVLVSKLDLETTDDNTIGLGLRYKF